MCCTDSGTQIRRRKRIALWLLATFAVGLVSSGFLYAQETPPQSRITLAVLNFANRNPGDGWDWLGTGLADMLITDLSKSSSLVVVERDRMAQALAELQLAVRGVVDPSTAGEVGRFARVDWVLFGSFIVEEQTLTIEAHIAEVGTGRLLRLEVVEGRPEELFGLEKRLACCLIERLGEPLTSDEQRAIEQLPTDSIEALEHYVRSLEHFDRGRWLDALRECRLSVRDDPAYVKPAARLAQLYREVGEPEHALVEYRKLVKRDTENALPEPVYFRMGRLLEEAFQDDAAAARAYERILARHPEYDQPFDIRDPSQPSRGWDDVGGIAGVRALAAAQDIGLRVLERLALMQSRAANDFEAARLYSRIVQFSSTHGMALAAGAPYGGFHDRVWGKYRPLYWRFVRQNRDSSLYPPLAVHAIPPKGMTVGPDTEPTHGFFKRQPFWLAAPDREIAELAVSVDTDSLESGEEHGYVEIQWRDPTTQKPIHGIRKFPKGTGAQTVRFRAEPGARVAGVHVFGTPSWQVAITLRPWPAEAAAVPAVGRFQVNFDPEEAQAVFLDGERRTRHRVRQGIAFTEVPAGEHVVEIWWPDGRKASKAFHLPPNGNVSIFLSAENRVFSRQVLAPPGSHTYLFADQQGRLWLLWDRAVDSYWSMNPSQDSDLFCSTSTSGTRWSTPTRMPVSSSSLDMQPILQQDRYGTYWLVWCSSRDPEDPKWLWIASSEDGAKWSFPRKIALPIVDRDDVARWRETHIPCFAFTIDQHNTLWLIWQGRLFRSEDVKQWTEVEVLRTKQKGPPDNSWFGLKHCLIHDGANGLLLLAKPHGLDIGLWQRKESEGWHYLGVLVEDQAHFGSVAVGNAGDVICVFAKNSGIFLKTYQDRRGWSGQIMIESYLKKPLHPSVASLPDGRCVVAYSCQDGIVTTLVDLSVSEFEGRE